MTRPLHHLEVLNAKDKALILSYLSDHFGIESGLPQVLLRNRDGDLFTVSRAVEDVSLQNLRVNSIGLYIGEWRNGELRLSMEGAQLLGPFAHRNVLELDAAQVHAWLRGEDIDFGDVPCPRGFQLVAYAHPVAKKRDFLGCGRFRASVLLNFVPKARRVKELILGS